MSSLKGKKIFLLEVNPRPGLSTNILYSIHKNIFKIKSYKRRFTFNIFHSSTVIYARKQINVNNKKKMFLTKFCLSKRFSELPNLGDIIKIDEPICLLHLKSKNRILLNKKIKQIESEFLKKIGGI